MLTMMIIIIMINSNNIDNSILTISNPIVALYLDDIDDIDDI
jgi:hypothetical protein